MYRYYCRRFLNLRGHHGGAYVLAVVEKLAKDDDAELWRELSIEFADCSRRVAFDFPLQTAADRRNSVRKARLLAEVTRAFCEALEEEAELAGAQKPTRRTS
jgi:hypothetical protein